MKRILLINPKRVGRGQSSVEYMSSTPLALPLLASLTPSDFEVKIVDENREELNFDEDVDLVGLSVMLHVAPRSIEIAKEFRKRGKLVVMGGFFPSLWPEKMSEAADSLVVGEGEYSWLALLDDMRNGRKLKPVYKQDKFINMTDIPFIKKEYMGGAQCYHVETTRGCPYACDFCSVTRFYGKTYRHRPIEDVVRQLEPLTDKMIFFVDDNITGNKEYAKKLFKAITPLKIVWSGQFTLYSAQDTELLDLARESGCRFLFTGFETLNQENLKDVNKTWAKPEMYPELVQKVHDAGIAIYGSFMFGFENDDVSVFKKTLDFTEENKIEFALFSSLFPIEGSKYYEKLKNEDRIFEFDQTKYNGQHSTYHPKMMTSEELDKGLLWIWQNFYSRGSIRKRIGHLSQRIKDKGGPTQDGKYMMEESMLYLNAAFRFAVEDWKA